MHSQENAAAHAECEGNQHLLGSCAPVIAGNTSDTTSLLLQDSVDNSYWMEGVVGSGVTGW